MNAAQRKFLIERIKSKNDAAIQALKKQLKKPPNKSNYIFELVMQGKLELQPPEVIKEALRQKALRARAGEDWLSEERSEWNQNKQLHLKIKDVIKLPKALKSELSEMDAHNSKIEEQIKDLQIQFETMEVRLQLASDKTLQGMINEVDDMGDLKLIDSKIKLLT